MAVAYQVVFVIDQDEANDNVAVPQNLAGALNYDCVNCLTYAVAQQLFVTLDGPLSVAAMAKIDEVWRQVGIYAAIVESGGVDNLSTIAPTFDAFTAQIKAIVEAEQPGTFPNVSSTVPPKAPPLIPQLIPRRTGRRRQARTPAPDVPGALGEIRTHTARVLNPFPLPVGIRGRAAYHHRGCPRARSSALRPSQ